MVSMGGVWVITKAYRFDPNCLVDLVLSEGHLFEVCAFQASPLSHVFTAETDARPS